MQYVGSTIDIKTRWANHKSSCNNIQKADRSKRTGLCCHFIRGCGGNMNKSKINLSLTLVDFYDTTETRLKSAKHRNSAGCRCKECGNLRRTEAKWIYQIGTIFGRHGLNSCEELEDINNYDK